MEETSRFRAYVLVPDLRYPNIFQVPSSGRVWEFVDIVILTRVTGESMG